jgi:hypothetical protein
LCGTEASDDDVAKKERKKDVSTRDTGNILAAAKISKFSKLLIIINQKLEIIKF